MTGGPPGVMGAFKASPPAFSFGVIFNFSFLPFYNSVAI
jgi:hypothetical protein